MNMVADIRYIQSFLGYHTESSDVYIDTKNIEIRQLSAEILAFVSPLHLISKEHRSKNTVSKNNF